MCEVEFYLKKKIRFVQQVIFVNKLNFVCKFKLQFP